MNAALQGGGKVKAKRKPDPSLAGQMDMFKDWQSPLTPPPPLPPLPPLTKKVKATRKKPMPAIETEVANTDIACVIEDDCLPLAANDVVKPPERNHHSRPGRPSLHQRDLVHHGRSLGDLDARALLRAPELSELLGLTLSTLAKLRCSGKGPPFYKLTNQTVGYRQEDVMEWLSHRRRVSTWSENRN
jgi:predicted DNA-binding transcriptional regulator AlpA